MLRSTVCLLSYFIILPSALSYAQELSYFRRDGGLVQGDQPLPDDFGDAIQVWRVGLSHGHSTPCICGDAIFLTTWSEANRELATVAINRTTGEVSWRRAVSPEEIETFHEVGSPAVCTPASNGEQLFVFFGSYGLICYDRDGNLLWEQRMGPFQDEFGASSSPVLVDRLVIVNQDHDVNSFLIAIDQQTGKTVWKTPREGFTRSYSTPVIWQRGDSKQIVVAGSLQLAGYDVASGEKLWWVNRLSRIVDPTPIISEGLVYIASWTPGGDQSDRITMEQFQFALDKFDKNGDAEIEVAELPAESPVVPRFYRIDLDGDKKLSQTEWERHALVFERAENLAMAIQPRGEGDITEMGVQWIQRRGLPTVPSSAVYQGVMYMVKDGGLITSLDVTDGSILKQGRAPGGGNYYASLVAGDGKVYVASELGVMTVLKAGKKWEILSSHDFGERIMATPVVSDGQFFIRTDEALYCFKSK